MTSAPAREQLQRARVMLVFTPGLATGRDPLEALSLVLDHVDVVQVRPKALGAVRAAPTEARAARDLCRAVLERTRAHPARPLVLVNDRVDVAERLAPEGVAGVHLGQDDAPWELARERLGPDALIGLSTHDMEQVALADDAGVDYLGFGPTFRTATKGYDRGLGPERAWIASEASSHPVFAIGGIDHSNVQDLATVGRVAVGSALLSAPSPARAARELRSLLLD